MNTRKLTMILMMALSLLVFAQPLQADDTERKIKELEERIENLEDGTPPMTSKEAHCAREMLGLNTDPVPYQCRRDQTEEDCQAAKDLMEKLQAEAREALEGICDE